MADKYYNIADMAKNTAERITQNADAWTDYLETAARLYRYGFKDQLLIHAQRPDATAVASIEVWNTRMHCWVNQGAKGIALLDETRKKKLRYVFDVSDVHKAKRIGIFPTLWEMKDQHHEAVMKRLEDIYGKTDEKRPIESRMIQIAEHIAEDYTPDVLQDLVNVQDDSLLYGLDEYNLSLRLKETMTSSIAYTLMARCGLDTDTYRDELDFSYIREFSTLDSLSVLGEATSSMCEPVLREICQVVEDIDRENARRVERESSEKDKNILANDGQEHYNTLKRESDTQNRKEGGTDYGTDIQERRGLSHSEHQSERGAGGEPDEVRNASGDISEGTSRGDLHREASVGNADGTLSDDTETGRGEVRETEKPDDGERGSDGGVKEQRSDGVGSSDELDNEQSGRDRSVGDRLQSVVEVEYKQLSIFPYLDEQMGTIAAAEAGMKSIAPAAFLLKESDIEDILRTGGGNSNSRERIYEKYRENRDSAYMADFLAGEYGTCGKGFEIDGHEIAAWFDRDGMKLGYGRSASDDFIMEKSWSDCEKVIAGMVKQGTFLDENRAFLADETVRRGVADNLYFFFRDSVGDMSVVDGLDGLDYQKSTEILFERLNNPEEAQKLKAAVDNEIAAVERGEKSFRWRLNPKPSELSDRVSGYCDKRKELPQRFDTETLKESFITQDEIDSVITRGSGFAGGKFRIHQYFLEGHDHKEAADFLKHEYGTGGSSHAIVGSDRSNQDHDARGLSITKGSLMNPYAKVVLTWKVVEKRIGELITEGKYLTPKEQEEYEKIQLAKAQAELDEALPEKDNLGQNVQKSEKTMEDAIEIVSEFLENEYGSVDDDFDDLTNISLAYTDFLDEETNEEHPVQVTLNLKEFSISTYVDDLLIDKKQYESLDDIYETELQYLSFDELVYLSDEDMEKVRDNEELVQAPLNTVAWDDIKPDTLGQTVQKFPEENFHIEDEALGTGSAKEKFARNVQAIKTIQSLEEEKRAATPEEQKILSGYVGWGGLADAFDENKAGWSAEYQELKNLLTPEEYASARESTLNAHYTSPAIIDGIYDTLSRMGFEKGNVLEPAMGVGNFFGRLPEDMAKSRLYGVELDSLTGRIAKQLYPKADIQIKGFEETKFPGDFFDVAVGNVPFGQYKVADRDYDKHNFLIHDYFFAKTLDKVRPGGVVAFVTSKGTMDKLNENVRKYLAERAELLGAVRLPNTAFKANAGTEVTSDIIFLQKRDRMVREIQDWVHTSEDEKGIRMNSYFAEHPEQIVGHMEMVSGPHGMESACIADTDRPFKEQINEALANIKGEIGAVTRELDEFDVADEDKVLPADPNVKNFSYTVVDNEVYYRENSVMKPVELPESKAERIKGLVAIRDVTRSLIDLQMEEARDGDIAAKMKELNDCYDDFEKKFGRINSRTNKSVFSQDASYSLLCSLEKFDSDGNFKEKADMFTKRTIKRAEVVTSVDTASEALAVSLSEKAKVDIPYMMELTGKSDTEITDDLVGVIFKEPLSEEWQTADEYLSGNVREKLAVAKSAAESRPEYEVNAKALEAVMPKDLEASEIEVRIGATWIKPEYVDQFMRETFKTPEYLTRSYGLGGATVGVQYSAVTGVWNVKGKNADRANPIANSTYGTMRANAYKILEDSLNLKDSRVYDTVLEEGKEKRVLNKKETTLASQKQEAIREAFKDWIFAAPERRADLVETYNKLFNSIRPREYEGAHLTFPGMSPEVTLRPHQKNAVAHQLYGDNTLLAHCVGAGKTWEMAAAAMESKRLGLCRKSLFVVPNHLTEQWGSDFLQLYPGANILVASKKDFEPANRKKFCSRIATGDYDAVIIGHTQFEKIPLSKERQAATIQEQIDSITEAIAQAKAERGERYTIKEMEKSKKNLTVRLEKLMDPSKKDSVVTFEQLGVDRLFVDESHNYKNLFLYTKMRNVAGIAQTDAQKSSDMFAKCRYMDELTGGKGVTFATGTPISNSMTELYTNMRYLQYGTLERMRLTQFDAWASSFGETQTAIELAPEGTGYRAKTRFAKFFNLPELISLFKESADIKTPDMLKLDVPEAVYENVVLKPSEFQKDVVASLADRAEMVRNGGVDSTVDNMLKITNDGRKLALDQRLINPMLPDDENSKTSVCVEKAFAIYEEEKETKGAQLIFCDLSTPKNDGNFNVYDDIKQKLMQKGVPENEIAFIHDANTETKKADLFAKVRSGDVRFLLGSTAKMGAGTNVQDRLIALHHLDVPWRPSDIEQQEGRIIRQGNMYKELGKPVKIFRYVTEGTFDSYSWQVIENKQKFIGQIMTSKSPVRSCEDVDEAALTYAEVKALCTGNPYIKEKMDLDIQVSKLKLLKANHTSQRYRLEDNITQTYPRQIAALSEKIAGYKADIATFKTEKAELAARSVAVFSDDGKEKEPFEIRIGKRVFTDRKEAGTALIEMCRNVHSISTPVKVGDYMGFSLAVTFEPFQKTFDLNIKGAISHHIDVGADAVGNMTRIANAMSGMETKLAKVEDQLSAVKEQLESAKEEVKKPFEKEQELVEKLDRLNELNALLNMDEKGDSEKEEDLDSKEIVDIEGDGYGEVPRDSEGDTISTSEAPVHDGMARGSSEEEKAEKKLCEEGECKHEKGEKSIFTRIADKKQQAGERTGIPGHTQIKGKGDER